MGRRGKTYGWYVMSFHDDVCKKCKYHVTKRLDESFSHEHGITRLYSDIIGCNHEMRDGDMLETPCQHECPQLQEQLARIELYGMCKDCHNLDIELELCDHDFPCDRVKDKCLICGKLKVDIGAIDDGVPHFYCAEKRCIFAIIDENEIIERIYQQG